MCGIVGFLGVEINSKNFDPYERLRAMASSIGHRGPDDVGCWVGEGVALAHTRLSIQDLSDAGRQPMPSHCGRYVIVFNGEIYNHLGLRKKLERERGDMVWCGHSDTETLINCISAWGIQKTLEHLKGMYAFAVWDIDEEQLTLARDRMGEKPLYWGWTGKTFLFGSELKALRSYSEFQPKINKEALALYLRYSYVPAPYSIYEGIHKLPAGSYVTVSNNQKNIDEVDVKSYWSLEAAAQNGIDNLFEGSPLDAVNAVESQLMSSIKGQLLSDVPLGAFLSGGIDSSTVVALMQELSSKPVSTYTIGFEEKGYNEAHHAKAVSKHLGTDHTELYLNANDSLAIIPSLPEIYCEPFADSSQIPTYLVSKLAKSDLTVALSGDGGDELFCGYNRYLAAMNVWKPMQKTPLFLRQFISFTAKSLPASRWNQLFDKLRPVLPERLKVSMAGEKIYKFADVLALDSGEGFYSSLTSYWNKPADIVINLSRSFNPISSWHDLDCVENSMMLTDQKTYLSDDILVKVDRAAMANSLETRVPMLDHEMVELAWRMPVEYKVRDGKGKWLLREILYKRVPREIMERPKAGFSLPLDSWLRGPLREWAEELLSVSRLEADGYFHHGPIRNAWADHLSGKANNQGLLWNILMFQAWLDNNR